MESLNAYLQNRFEVRKARSPDQEKAWNRADAVIEICKWLYLAEVMQMTRHLEPHEIIATMDYAKKHGEKPKNFFRYLVNEKKMPMVRREIHGDVPGGREGNMQEMSRNRDDDEKQVRPVREEVLPDTTTL